ncbi:TonB-dependent receptor domain-containing protein [Sphingomonas aurea]|uniref:TonB-dependent receptor domain-containing protein n=1 Tax=Sphingomonas aurea TaxID=3063994 RepID=UPI00272F467D|nr:TonB-dependent receptor [Sphingomonas sp. KR1UV-12]
MTATPTVAQATAEIERTPGGVEVVPDTTFKNTPVQTIKDVLQYVPGVIVQPRMGDDVRLSIRGSGLSRAYGVRGLTLSIDGIPMNTSDGLLDFFEVDPSAYRYVEVFKGANALRFGSNALGGAINLVTPVGRDASPLDARVDVGSFGYVKGQASTGGVSGDFDYFATVSAQTNDGYRDHSEGHQFRGNLNLGYRISPDVETRFYLYATSTKQRIPGEVSKDQALNDPRSANPEWVRQDQQRNVRSIRVANKTTARLGDTIVEAGVFYNNRHVRHPIFQWLDFTVDDYGAFVRAVDDRSLGLIRNRLIVGANLQNGTIDTEQFVNLTGAVKGALAASLVDTSRNFSIYAEDSLFVAPNLALIGGLQYLHARRDRRDRFLSNGDQSGAKTYNLWSPRAGILWDVSADAQVFGNVSRSAEVPTYDANSFATPASANLRAQRATTEDERTRSSALVTGAPYIRFYAGAVLRSPEGEALGTLCVIGHQPRPQGLSERQRTGLLALARQVMAQLELRRTANAERRLRIELAGGRSRFEAIFNSAIDYAIVVMDEDGRITDWNEGATRILGWTPDEIRGHDLGAFFTPEDRTAGVPQREMNDALALGRGIDERWHLRRSGERFWANGEMMTQRDEGGEAIGFVKVLRDRTEARLIQEQLALKDERLQMALSASGSVGLWDWMVDSDLLHGDDNFARLYGLDPAATAEGLTEEQYQEHVVAEDLDALRRRIRAVFERGEDFLVESRLVSTRDARVSEGGSESSDREEEFSTRIAGGTHGGTRVQSLKSHTR